jgi:simple sugar transport system ATP-binding protein
MIADTCQRENVIRDNLVCMQGVSVRFGKIVALDRVNLQVGRNEIVALIGDNGVGKSTLIKALIGCHTTEAGEIYFDGRKVDFRSPREARLAGIETGYQDFALVDILSVSRNFFLGREHLRSVGPFKLLDHRKMDEVTRVQLEALGFQGRIDPHQSVSQLSGGERQMIAIARAIYFGAKLLILDEPTSALPESGVELVLGAVKKAKKAGLSVIFVTHKVGEIFQVADRFVVLQKGRNYADFRREDTNLRELERLFIHSRLTVMHEMAASIAHQVRNPLSVMRVSVEMLRDNFPAQGKKEEFGEIVHLLLNEIGSLQHVVDNFLEFARPPKDQRSLAPVEETIRAAMEGIPLANFPQHRVSVSIQEGIQYTMDKNLIQQAIGNLLLNALEATPREGKVEVRAFVHNGHLCIEVQDWGSGIDDETRKRIFDFFYTTKKTGAGLGLAIVHRIVEQHGGTIIVNSAPGVGSTFRIEI